MKKYIPTLFRLIHKSKEENLSLAANDMTYKLLLALFPFIMFVMAVLGFFNLDIYYITDNLNDFIPTEIIGLVEIFIKDIVNVRRPNLLSFSILLTLYSSSSGFMSLITGINKAHHLEDRRNFIKIYLVSFLMVLTFTLALAVSIVGIVFSTLIIETIGHIFTISLFSVVLYNFLLFVISLGIIIFAVVVLMRLALVKKLRLKELLPGAIFTTLGWIISSFGFNIYVTNWSNMSSVYGSVGTFMVLMLWLNLICNVILLGAGLNAVLIEEKNEQF